MIKRIIRYTDYNDEVREEPFYFNINKLEYHDLDNSIPGGVQRMMQTLVEKKDVSGVINVIRTFVEKAYGVKSPDGKRMIKNQEVLDEFVQSEAYVVLLEELTADAKDAAEFLAGILPIDKDRREEAVREAINAANTAELTVVE